MVEAAAAMDGSFGWCLTNANTMGRMVAYLAPEVASDWVTGPDCQMAWPGGSKTVSWSPGAGRLPAAFHRPGL